MGSQGTTSQSESSPSPASADAAGASTGQQSVLVCDDEVRLALLTAGLIEDAGFESATTTQGDLALDLLSKSEQHFDVLLLDVNLSTGPTASEVLAEIEKRQLAVRVVLTSGLAAEDVPASLMQHASVTSYLGKPYSVDELVSAIEGAIVP